MYNIYLIFTQHKVSGKCNSTELFKIIKKIEPEVIFEELSCSNFEKAYKEKSLITVETGAITRYLKNYSIEHIPIDTYPLPNNYYDKIDCLLKEIIYSNYDDSFKIRYLLEEDSLMIIQDGFNYLNSKAHEKVFEDLDTLKKKILNKKDDKELNSIASLEKDTIDKREVEMIDNIYRFSEKHKYNNAIQFIGSGHRKSIIKKIDERLDQETIKINWIINDNYPS